MILCLFFKMPMLAIGSTHWSTIKRINISPSRRAPPMSLGPLHEIGWSCQGRDSFAYFYTRKPTNGLDFHYNITENRVVQHRGSKVKMFKLKTKDAAYC
jgi:hypothetical protein